MICTFFGNKDAPETIRPMLEETINRLVTAGVDLFFLGNQGNFDRLILDVIRSVYRLNPCFRYYVVLAYPEHDLDPDETLYPEGLEKAPPKFAIDRRNRWMIDRADIVAVYSTHPGYSAKYREIAIKKMKVVIDLE